ncbi:MAG: hypothetical protein ABIC57_04260 [bacterium]
MKSFRKLWKITPIWILVPIITIFAAGVVFAAYTIITITGETTVTEPISVSPSSFTIGGPGDLFYPTDTRTVTITLTNAASNGIEVNFVTQVSPIDPEIDVAAPAKVTIPAMGNTTADIEITASKSAAPQTFSISVGITR